MQHSEEKEHICPVDNEGLCDDCPCHKDPYQVEKKWNANNKNCSKCDSKHICVECVCPKCHTVDLDTMVCGCSPSQKLKEDTLDNLVRDFTTVIPKSKSEVRRRIQEYVTSELQSLMEEIEKLPTRKEYDGNNLESACRAYHIGAENWDEILRLEDGQELFKETVLTLLTQHMK